MLVTRSSVSALQANRGLPIGTQIVGWIVLRETFPVKVTETWLKVY